MSSIPTWQIVTMALKDLKAAPYNPRRISPAALQGLTNSIERFGNVRPIVFNKRTGHVVGGHQTIKSLRSQKVENAQVVLVDIDENDEKALNIALNNPAIAGEFTDDLQSLLAAVKAGDEQLFSDLLLGELLSEATAKTPATHDADEIPATPKKATTKLGDVWTLGRHRLICGDSTKPETLAKLLAGKAVQALVTDPPYGVDYGDAKAQTFKKIRTHHRDIQNDARRDYREWFASWLKIIPWASYATFYVFMADGELTNLRLAIDDCKYAFGNYLVWAKDRLVMGRKDYKARHEFIVYGWPKRHRFYGPSNRNTVLEFVRPAKHEHHPTAKPVALVEQLVSDGAPKGGAVLDIFGGSGSTLMACESQERVAYVAEIDPLYCDVIVQRFEEYSGKKATRGRRT